MRNVYRYDVILRRRLPSLIVLASLLLVMPRGSGHALRLQSRASTRRPTVEFQIDPFRYLPAGARMEHPESDLVRVDLDGDKRPEVVIFYVLGRTPVDSSANIAILKQFPAGYKKVWEISFPDSWGFEAPTEVADINGRRRPQILAYRRIGAGCPGILEIYEWKNGGIQRITGAWADNGQCQSVDIRDLDGNGSREIIVRIRNYGVLRDIYQWNGKRYVLANVHFSRFYDDDLRQLLGWMRSLQRLPASARIMLANQIAGIYIIQRRYPASIEFCHEALRIIKDGNLTEPDSVYSREGSEGQIYRLMGDTYKAAGDRSKSVLYYRRSMKP